MATTVTLSSEIVNEVKSLTGARTKTEAVRKALSDYVRARRRRELIEMLGKITLRYSNEELEALEEEVRR